MRQSRHGLALGREALAVDGRDLDDLEVELFGRLLEARPAAERVLELVAEIVNGIARLAQLQLVGELALGFLEALRVAGDDLQDLRDVPAERGLDRLGDGTLRGLEGGRRELGHRHVGLLHRAEIKRRLAGELVCDLVEAFALGDARGGVLGAGLVLEDDLAQHALLGNREIGQVRLVFVLQLVLRDRHPWSEVVGRHHHRRDRAILGCREGFGMVLVIGLEVRFARGGDVRHRAGTHEHGLGRAPLVAVAVEVVEHHLGHGTACRDRLRHLAAHEVLPRQRHEALLAIAGVVEQRLEDAAVELALGVAEGDVVEDRLPHHRVAHRDPGVARREIEKHAADHLPQHPLRQAELAGALGGHLGLQHRLQPAQLAAVLILELLRHDALRAHLGDVLRADAATEDVADAPDGEAEDQHAEHHAHDDARHDGLEGEFRLLRHRLKVSPLRD